MVNARKNKEYPIETWEEMKAVMTKRFMPSYYYQELYQNCKALGKGIGV